MKTESRLFAGSALFFGAIGFFYLITSYDETGTTLLASGLAAAAFLTGYLGLQSRRSRLRPEDRSDGSPAEGDAPLGYFPSESIWPFVTAVGGAIAGLGLIFGIWLLIGGGLLLAGGLAGITFQR